jgi:hypothetical protein
MPTTVTGVETEFLIPEDPETPLADIGEGGVAALDPGAPEEPVPSEFGAGIRVCGDVAVSVAGSAEAGSADEP